MMNIGWNVSQDPLRWVHKREGLIIRDPKEFFGKFLLFYEKISWFSYIGLPQKLFLST